MQVNVIPHKNTFFKSWENNLSIFNNYNIDKLIQNLSENINMKDNSESESESKSESDSDSDSDFDSNEGNWEQIYDSMNKSSRFEQSNYQPEITIMEENYTSYEYIKKYMSNFYNNINISYREIYNNNYKLEDIIKNKNIFFSNIYIDNNTGIEYINKLNEKYIILLNNIFIDKNLKDLLKEYDNNYFIQICNTFHIFSPSYIAQKYHNNILKYGELNKDMLREELTNLINDIKVLISKFKNELILIIEEYNNKKNDVKLILENRNYDYILFEDYILDMTYLILFYCNKLLDYNILPIHKIIVNIFNKYTNINIKNIINIKSKYIFI